MIYNITPVAKPRMTISDKWKKRSCVMKYREFKDRVREEGVIVPECGAKIVFFMPMPKSWSKKKRGQMSLRPHKQVPDLDNLVKALLDALFENDSHIWHYEAEKKWDYVGYITICSLPKKEERL